MTSSDLRVVFVVGSPRSGTTWLQTLLGAHPQVVTPQETDLFATVVAPMQAAWDRQLDLARAQGRRAKGLPTLLREDEFRALVGSVIDKVVGAISALDPAATVVVEKSPAHSQHTDLIARYLPEAWFVHIVRDGRDVVSSLRAASQGWGRHWAPGEIKRGARLWRDTVISARAAEATGRYVEIRYEDLRAGDPLALRLAFAACGLTVDDDRCRELLDDYSLARMSAGAFESPIAVVDGTGARASRIEEPSGFYGTGSVGGWAKTWTTRERLLFDAVAGDLLVALGYEHDRSWSGSGLDHRRFDAWVRAQRLVGLAGRRIGYGANLLMRRVPDSTPRTAEPASDREDRTP